jgi:hypothetical protein
MEEQSPSVRRQALDRQIWKQLQRNLVFTFSTRAASLKARLITEFTVKGTPMWHDFLGCQGETVKFRL